MNGPSKKSKVIDQVLSQKSSLFDYSTPLKVSGVPQVGKEERRYQHGPANPADYHQNRRRETIGQREAVVREGGANEQGQDREVQSGKSGAGIQG